MPSVSVWFEHRRPPAAQLAYSEQMAAMRDEDKRRRKAAKILAVLRHVLGRTESRGCPD